MMYGIIWITSCLCGVNAALAARQKNWHSAIGWGVAATLAVLANLLEASA